MKLKKAVAGAMVLCALAYNTPTKENFFRICAPLKEKTINIEKKAEYITTVFNFNKNNGPAFTQDLILDIINNIIYAQEIKNYLIVVMPQKIIIVDNTEPFNKNSRKIMSHHTYCMLKNEEKFIKIYTVLADNKIKKDMVFVLTNHNSLVNIDYEKKNCLRASEIIKEPDKVCIGVINDKPLIRMEKQ